MTRCAHGVHYRTVAQSWRRSRSMPNHSCELVDFILVGCVKRKHHRAGPAKDVYTSTLWQYRRAYAESHGRPWYILSAKHGLLAPSTWIERYDLSLADLSVSGRREWSLRVLDDRASEVPALDGKIIEVHAGKLYVEYGLEKGLWEIGAVIRSPLAHVVGQGRQYVWYREHTNSCSQKG